MPDGFDAHLNWDTGAMEGNGAGSEHPRGFWVGDWFIEPMLNRAFRDDETVQLEPKVMDVLVLMAEQPGKTVTKEAFMDRVWGDTVVTNDVLSRCISQLRKLFGDDARDPDYIETIRKTGYRLIASVRPPDGDEALPSGAVEERPHITESGGTEDTGGQDSERRRSASYHADQKEVPRWTDVARGFFKQYGVLLAVGIAIMIMAGVGLGVLPLSTPSVQGPASMSAVPMTSFQGRELESSLSPDGNQVVFTWNQNAQGHRNIYLMQQGASEPLRLTEADADEWSPTWSPDGQYVAFVRSLDEGCGLFVVSSIGGEEQQIAQFPRHHAQSIAWSPDPSRQSFVLALQMENRATYSLYRFAVEADTLIELTDASHAGIGDINPVFSPSGSRIAFTRASIGGIHDIFVVSADGGTPARVTADSTQVTGLDWTADGEQLVFASERTGPSALWRVDAGGGSPERLPVASERATLGDVSVAREKNRIAYTQQLGQVDIWKLSDPINYAVASTARFISSTRWDANPDIAPDGSRVAFISNRSGHPEVWTTSPSGTKTRQVTTMTARGTQSPRWSPHGRRIAFASRGAGRADIYIASEDGSSPEQITSDPAEDLYPTWSHDGTALYFTSNRSGMWEIWKIPAQGGAAMQVTQGGATIAQEHPDGSKLYIARTDTAGLWAIPLSGTMQPFVLSPEMSSADSVEVSQGTNTDPSSPSWTRVVPSLAPFDFANWQVRRRGIYFLQRRAGSERLAFYRFSTRQISPVFLLQGIPHEPSLTAAPEGDWFLYTRTGLQGSDVFLVENVQGNS